MTFMGLWSLKLCAFIRICLPGEALSCRSMEWCGSGAYSTFHKTNRFVSDKNCRKCPNISSPYSCTPSEIDDILQILAQMFLSQQNNDIWKMLSTKLLYQSPKWSISWLSPPTDLQTCAKPSSVCNH